MAGTERMTGITVGPDKAPDPIFYDANGKVKITKNAMNTAKRRIAKAKDSQ